MFNKDVSKIRSRAIIFLEAALLAAPESPEERTNVYDWRKSINDMYELKQPAEAKILVAMADHEADSGTLLKEMVDLCKEIGDEITPADRLKEQLLIERRKPGDPPLNTFFG